MYSYVTRELPEVVKTLGIALTGRQGIFGHSMGGHGALVCALRNPNIYRSVSALAPIAAPSQCPWGDKAFKGYLGEDRESWLEYDATALIGRARYSQPILIDQGSNDKFLSEQLKPELFESACRKSGAGLELRYRDGYDHGYYFISTFIAEHLRHHAQYLS
jgi:S-formylglutathione hydrolase